MTLLPTELAPAGWYWTWNIERVLWLLEAIDPETG